MRMLAFGIFSLDEELAFFAMGSVFYLLGSFCLLYPDLVSPDRENESPYSSPSGFPFGCGPEAFCPHSLDPFLIIHFEVL